VSILESTFTVAARGIGKPDYSREISAGQFRPGLTLKYLQTLRPFLVGFSAVASAFSWIKSPLAAGATAHYVDGETGLDLPVLTDKGYTLTLLSVGISCNQDIECWLSLGYSPFAILRHLGAGHIAGGIPYYQPEVVGFTSAFFDPTGATPFYFDLTVYNAGLAAMEGQLGMYMIYEAVGTSPRPIVKTVKCKWCGATKEVPRETTNIICDECGQLFIVLNTSRFRGT